MPPINRLHKIQKIVIPPPKKGFAVMPQVSNLLLSRVIASSDLEIYNLIGDDGQKPTCCCLIYSTSVKLTLQNRNFLAQSLDLFFQTHFSLLGL